MEIIIILKFVLLIILVFCLLSEGNSNTGKLGDIEFECQNGHYFHGGFCLYPIDVPMTWDMAKRTCERQGQSLAWMEDEDDYNAVAMVTKSSMSEYWIGYFRCNNALAIQTKFVCDGLNDCGDNSDEMNCSNKCTFMINATYAMGESKPSGIISSSGIYDNRKTCRWTVFTNVGSTIRLTVTTFNTERSVDTMAFTTGGQEGSINLGEISGSVTNRPTFLSADHVMNIILQTDQTILGSGFTITWTTDVPEIFSNVQTLTAIDTIQNLKSPFYDMYYLSHEKVFEWIITAQTNNSITLQFVNIDIGNGKLYLWDGIDISPNSTLTMTSMPEENIYMSGSKSVRLMLKSDDTNQVLAKGFHIKYWQGCTLDLIAGKGSIHSPGYYSDKYPDNVDCTWTIRRPTSERRSMSLKFGMFQLQSLDYVKIYNDTIDTAAIHTGHGFSESYIPPMVTSSTGYIKIIFTSSFVLGDKGFAAVFSLDCPKLIVSSETIVLYTEGTLFESKATWKCNKGFSFAQDEYNQLSEVMMQCGAGGVWNNDRTPYCQTTYCPIPPPVANGYILQSSGLHAGGNVTYQCFDGFFKIGATSIKCQDNGHWEAPPSCYAVQCPQLTAPANGGLVNDSREFGSLVTITCNSGYETMGSITTYCKNGGQWSHPPATCTRIFCPTPEIRHGILDRTQGIQYAMTITLTCDSGFHINERSISTNTAALTCQSDAKILPLVQCVDINECMKHNTCPNTEDCLNTIGSYKCVCKQGFERLTPNAVCTVINKCAPNSGKGPCDQKCETSGMGYTCSCDKPGHILYMYNGFNNISLPDGEDGMRQGDVYRFNHSCVRVQCPVPTTITNGKVLSQKQLFFFEDTLEFVCNLGYVLIGVPRTICGSNGWVHPMPTCYAVFCSIPSLSSLPRSTKIYANASVVYGGMVKIECQYGSVRINRTLYCTYDKGTYKLAGDAVECPEISCGAPVSVPGSSPAGLTRGSLGDSYAFGCEDGFVLSGMSLHGNKTVTCLENGTWNIGSLFCTGGRCLDPGTPGGAKQVVKSYEVGQLLSFQCEDYGFYPEPSAPFMCIVKDGTVKWNTTNLPECVDKLPPVFTNCLSDPVYAYRTEEYIYSIPVATDNSGAVKRISSIGDYRPGLRTNTPFTIAYVAEDFSGNSATCIIEIRIKEFNQIILDCPESNVMVFISEATGKYVNMSSYVVISGKTVDDTIRYLPGDNLKFDHSFIGVSRRIDAQATDKWNNKKQCSFLVETKASVCFRESFPSSVSNGQLTCTGTSGDVSCSVTCNAGYVFNDGNNTKMYECRFNQWTPSLPPDTCIKYDNLSFIITMEVVYTSTSIASLCLDGHKQQLINNKAAFTQEIFVKCNNDIIGNTGAVEISEMVSTSSSFDFNTIFTVKLLDSTKPQSQKEACKSVLDIYVKTRGDFLDYTSTSSCSSGTTTVTRKVSSSGNRVLTSGNQCSDGIKKIIDEKCEYNSPSFIITMQLVYTSTSVASLCLDGHKQQLTNNKELFTKEIYDKCNSDIIGYTGAVAILGMESTSSSFDFNTIFTVRLLNLTTSESQKQACTAVLNVQVTRTDFLDYTSAAACTSGTTKVTRKTSNGNKVISSGIICDDAGRREMCVPCPPGQYSSAPDTCTECPDGMFQNYFGQSECKNCPSDTSVPSSDKTTCVAVCPSGFISGNGLPPCRPCQKDQYWVNETTCVSCPRNGSTLGFNALSSTSGCKLPCAQGTYSKSGYEPCLDCPISFYQDDTAQNYCKPCGTTQITQGTKSTAHNQCIDGSGCNMEYLGTKRGQDEDWNVSDVNPFQTTVENCLQFCLDLFSCAAVHYTSGTCFVFNIMGILETNADTRFYTKRCVNTSQNVSCITRCGGHGVCFYKHSIPLCDCQAGYYGDNCEQELDSCDSRPCWNGGTCIKTGYNSYNCSCPVGFGSSRCEVDLVNPCTDANFCSQYGMCQNLLGNEAKCLCPVTGVFTGNRCEVGQNLCFPDPCVNGGTCISYGSVRFQCMCRNGFTGTNCDTNIDECSLNPNGCLFNGTCVDGIEKYTCTCVSGFTGDRCKDAADFCQLQNPCSNGMCYNDYTTLSPVCVCKDSFRNDGPSRCVAIPNCESDSCVNGKCNTGTGKCDCTAGFEGSLCQHNIDDCKSMPCKNNATCIDKLRDYECDCPLGYDGKNCTNNINRCVGMCTAPNAEGCDVLINDYICRCKPGFMGKDCNIDINECLSYPCQHSGACTDLVNDFVCRCTDGWEGKTCYTTKTFCTSSTCENDGECYNMIDGTFCKCKPGTTGPTCRISSYVCNVITPCLNQGVCKNVGGTAMCDCPIIYDGSNCHLINDVCGMSPSPCQNEGQCKNKDLGYQCTCAENYSGMHCQTYTDPCSSGPCHASAQCLANKDKYMCYCDKGRPLTDQGCKGLDEDFDIFFDSLLRGPSTRLNQPFVLPKNSNLTILFWTRLGTSKSNPATLVELGKVDIGTDKFDENGVIKISYSKHEFFGFHGNNPNILDGKWHCLVLSVDFDGNVKFFIDAIRIFAQKLKIDRTILESVWQINIGAGTHGRISQLRIYRTFLSDNDIFKSMENYNHLPDNDLVQGWTNIAVSTSVTRIYPSSYKDNSICDTGILEGCPHEDRTKPAVYCPQTLSKHGTNKLTDIGSIKNIINYTDDVTIKKTSMNEDDAYTFGSTNEVFVGYDQAGNYGLCHLKVYIKYNEECPRLVTDGVISYCTEKTDDICGLSCNGGSALSRKHRYRYNCGKLGVFDSTNPYKSFVLPTCGATSVKISNMTVRMTYELKIMCYEPTANSMRDRITNKITGEVQTNWPGLCSFCSPTVTTKCQKNSKLIQTEFTISGVTTMIAKNLEAYTSKDAILISIHQDKTFEFNEVAGAVLHEDSVVVEEVSFCPSGFGEVRDKCVSCGRGTYKNETAKTCEYCPVGTYQPLQGQTSCPQCPEDLTTLTFGSVSGSDCIDACQPGTYYDQTYSSCKECHLHFYQNMSGQEFCFPCPFGTETADKGAHAAIMCYGKSSNATIVDLNTEKIGLVVILGIIVGVGMFIIVIIIIVTCRIRSCRQKKTAETVRSENVSQNFALSVSSIASRNTPSSSVEDSPIYAEIDDYAHYAPLQTTTYSSRYTELRTLSPDYEYTDVANA